MIIIDTISSLRFFLSCFDYGEKNDEQDEFFKNPLSLRFEKRFPKATKVTKQTTSPLLIKFAQEKKL